MSQMLLRVPHVEDDTTALADIRFGGATDHLLWQRTEHMPDAMGELGVKSSWALDSGGTKLFCPNYLCRGNCSLLSLNGRGMSNVHRMADRRARQCCKKHG